MISLAQTLGEAKPRATPENVIASLETGKYKDWKTPDSDQRCPICLDDVCRFSFSMGAETDCQPFFSVSTRRRRLKARGLFALAASRMSSGAVFFFLVTCHNCQTNILHRNGLKVQAHVLSAAKLSEAVRVGQHRIIIIFIIIIRTNMAPIGGAMIMEVLALLGQERLVTVDR